MLYATIAIRSISSSLSYGDRVGGKFVNFILDIIDVALEE